MNHKLVFLHHTSVFIQNIKVIHLVQSHACLSFSSATTTS